MAHAFGNNRFNLHFAVTVLALAVAVAAPALQIARMKMPAELATESVRLHASGYGGANRGHFDLGDYSGDFTRIESRFAVFDPLYAANRGRSAFTLEGPDVTGTIAADCHFKERVITVGVLTFDAKKLAYVCDIADGSGTSFGSLTLGEPKPDGLKERMLARASRHGVADIGEVRIGIASVHHYEGSRLSSQTPVGYVLTHDSQPVGALELTDSDPTFFFHSGATPAVRRATLIAALGLSVLRDPANSALGD
jgi:hypothetical protein